MAIGTIGTFVVVEAATAVNKVENANVNTNRTLPAPGTNDAQLLSHQLNEIVALRAERFWPLRERRGSCRPTISRRTGASDKGPAVQLCGRTSGCNRIVPSPYRLLCSSLCGVTPTESLCHSHVRLLSVSQYSICWSLRLNLPPITLA